MSKIFYNLLSIKHNTGELVQFIADSVSLKNVCNLLEYSDNGRNTKTLREFCIANNISLDHFSKNGKQFAKKSDKVCPVCLNVFQVTDYIEESKPQTTCSYACANTYFRSGVNAGNYQGKEFSGQSALRRNLKADKCAVCDEKEVIDIHHMDQDRTNNDPSNMIPLCPTHHAYIHRGKLDLILDKLEEYFKRNIEE